MESHKELTREEQEQKLRQAMKNFENRMLTEMEPPDPDFEKVFEEHWHEILA